MRFVLYSLSSSCRHEFLLVHIDTDRESHMLIVERIPSNNGVQVVSSSGGVARDTVTVVRAREHYKYRQRASQNPVCKGTLRWEHPSAHLVDIAFIARAASATFEYQCYRYARITLTATAKAFPSCSREGTTSLSRRWLPLFGTFQLPSSYSHHD